MPLADSTVDDLLQIKTTLAFVLPELVVPSSCYFLSVIAVSTKYAITKFVFERIVCIHKIMIYNEIQLSFEKYIRTSIKKIRIDTFGKTEL